MRSATATMRTSGPFSSACRGFFLPQLYVRGAVGAGGVSTDDDDGLHVALGGGLGFELVQMADFALGVELAGTWLHLPKADWNSLGANLVVSFF